MNIDYILETAHITVSTATLKVVVEDVRRFEPLFFPRCAKIDNDVYQEDPEWKVEMGFPPYVLSVSPWYDDNTLSIWVTHPWDEKELSDWLASISISPIAE